MEFRDRACHNADRQGDKEDMRKPDSESKTLDEQCESYRNEEADNCPID